MFSKIMKTYTYSLFKKFKNNILISSNRKIKSFKWLSLFKEFGPILLAKFMTKFYPPIKKYFSLAKLLPQLPSKCQRAKHQNQQNHFWNFCANYVQFFHYNTNHYYHANQAHNNSHRFPSTSFSKYHKYSNKFNLMFVLKIAH